MPFTNAALNAGTNGITAGFPFLSLHTADPGATGASESAATTGGNRINPTWPAASGTGDSTVTNVNFVGGAASGPCTFVGMWSLATGGVFGGGFALTGDLTFNAAGEYTLTNFTVNGTAT
jgi:hypothetical protein